MKILSLPNIYTIQILGLTYFTGILWLRRNPMSLVFSVLALFSTLFLLLAISYGTYVQYAVTGSVVMTMVALGLALIEDISYYKLEYRIQDIL